MLLFINAVWFEIKFEVWGEGGAHVMLRQSCIEYVLMKEVSMLTFHCQRNVSSGCRTEFAPCSMLMNQLRGCRREAQCDF